MNYLVLKLGRLASILAYFTPPDSQYLPIKLPHLTYVTICGKVPGGWAVPCPGIALPRWQLMLLLVCQLLVLRSQLKYRSNAFVNS